MLRRLARTTVIVVAALVAVTLAARVMNRRRSTPAPTEAWPPITPVPDVVEDVEVVVDVEREVVDRNDSGDAAWVEPVDESCPTSHPIKGKLSSGIFHAPGGLNYDRTKPDRCYLDPAAAEADGLRPSKR